MAAGRGMMGIRTPIRMRPPAIPKMPDRKAVDIIRAASARIMEADTRGASGLLGW